MPFLDTGHLLDDFWHIAETS